MDTTIDRTSSLRNYHRDTSSTNATSHRTTERTDPDFSTTAINDTNREGRFLGYTGGQNSTTSYKRNSSLTPVMSSGSTPNTLKAGCETSESVRLLKDYSPEKLKEEISDEPRSQKTNSKTSNHQTEPATPQNMPAGTRLSLRKHETVLYKNNSKFVDRLPSFRGSSIQTPSQRRSSTATACGTGIV